MARISINPIFMSILMTLAISSEAGVEKTETTVLDSRYLSIKVGPDQAQTDLLQGVVNVQIPAQIHTVGAALEYLLEPYGFRLTDCESEDTEQYLLLVLSLPHPHRNFGPIKLFDALSILGGEGFSPIINPVKRTVCYQLRDGYQHYINGFDIEQATEQWLQRHFTIQESLYAEPPVKYYGPVQDGESLSSIIEKIDIGGSTREQALVHLFKANTDTFADHNMNRLLAGAMLSIPSFQHDLLPGQAEASQVVEKHFHLWAEQKVAP